LTTPLAATAGLAAIAPPASGQRRLDIQGLRAVAVLVVVAYHAGLPVPGGFVGVDVFFVISGFVIAAMLHREWQATGRVRFGQFYVRRFKRLTPALALVVTITMLFAALILSPLGTQETTAQTGIGAMLLGANVVIARTTGDYFDLAADTNALLNTWSLSVEEQFYLAFPLILVIGWLLAARLGRRAAPILIVATLAAASFGLAVLDSAGFGLIWAQSLAGFYGPFTRAWEFAVGALLALILTTRVLTSRPGLLAGALGAILLAASLWLISGETPFPGPWTLLPVAGAGLLLASGTASNTVSRVLASTPMVKVGDWSYSIYLWHWPFIVFASALWPGNPAAKLGAAGLSLLPALASYVWLEQPIRSAPNLRGAALGRLILITLLTPILASWALIVAAQNSFWSPSIKDFATSTLKSHIGHDAGCDTRMPLGQGEPGRCTWNREETGRPIYLVGDSNADHFSEGVISAGRALHRPVIVSTTNACPFLDIYFVDGRQTRADNDKCRAFVQSTLRFLESSASGTVIISGIDRYWYDATFSAGLDRASLTTDRAGKLLVLESGLSATVEGLRSAKQDVMLIQTIPLWLGEDGFSPTTCSTIALATRTCNRSMPVDRAELRQGEVRDVLKRVSDTQGSSLMDPWTSLCPEGLCATDGDGIMRYRNGSHISVGESEALGPLFTQVIASIA